MTSALFTSYTARRKLVVLLTVLLGVVLLFASCGTVKIKPVSRLEATPAPRTGDTVHTSAAKKRATSPAPPTPTKLPTVVGKISCPPLPAPNATSLDRFLTCEYNGGFDHEMTVYVYVPNNYNPSKAYPAVLMLHGVGESADPSLPLSANRAEILGQEYIDVWGPGSPAGGPSIQTKWPSFVIVPQLVGSNRWVDSSDDVASYSLTTQPTLSLQMAIDSTILLEKIFSGIDTQRLYITGISMGAYGVWDSILRWPSLFAAAVPVSGAGDPALAKRIVDLPLWDFHGGDDNVVPVAGSQLMIQALQTAGGRPCYTQFPGQLHVIWDLVYGYGDNLSNPLYPWLFSQIKSHETVAFSCG